MSTKIFPGPDMAFRAVRSDDLVLIEGTGDGSEAEAWLAGVFRAAMGA